MIIQQNQIKILYECDTLLHSQNIFNVREYHKLDQLRNSIYLYNQELLEKNIFKNFFKHSNFTSFVKQLNLYNFKKAKSNEGFIFKHIFFKKGTKQMLQYILKKNKEEKSLHIKEEQNLFQECANDIKQTNNKLKDDMNLLQAVSSFLIDQMKNLNQYIYNQTEDFEQNLSKQGRCYQLLMKTQIRKIK